MKYLHDENKNKTSYHTKTQQFKKMDYYLFLFFFFFVFFLLPQENLVFMFCLFVVVVFLIFFLFFFLFFFFCSEESEACRHRVLNPTTFLESSVITLILYGETRMRFLMADVFCKRFLHLNQHQF